VNGLVDRLERPLGDLRISVVDRCNFRCPYCMPASIYGDDYRYITPADRLSDEEIVRLAGLFVELGVRKLRITGGEPLIRRGIADLVAALAAIEPVEDLALTTNGALLAQHAESLHRAGLGRLTISFDSLDKRVFADMSGGRGNVDQVLQGIAAAERAGFESIKLNTVVKRDTNEHTVIDLLDHFRGTGHIVRFIEFMDVGTFNAWRPEDVVPARELIELISSRWRIEPLDERYFGEVARRYRYTDGQGEIGFVNSISQPFCGSCTRARLSSEGVLYTCLFATRGLDLRGPMRDGASDQQLSDLISARWRRRADRYSEERGEQRSKGKREKVEMYRVGG
jgi:cyclic pyranopterin phosphate synthase